jgi:small-conductance mechanosensitive channel
MIDYNKMARDTKSRVRIYKRAIKIVPIALKITSQGKTTERIINMPFLALFILMVIVASVTVATWFLGAIIGTVMIGIGAVALAGFLLIYSAIYLWELIKMVFKPKKKSPSNFVKN